MWEPYPSGVLLPHAVVVRGQVRTRVLEIDAGRGGIPKFKDLDTRDLVRRGYVWVYQIGDFDLNATPFGRLYLRELDAAMALVEWEESLAKID